MRRFASALKILCFLAFPVMLGGIQDAKGASRPEPAPASELGGNPIVLGLQLDEPGSGAKVQLEFSDPVTPRIIALSHPDRLVIDLPKVQWAINAAPRPSGLGVIRHYRYGSFRTNVSRLVIDLNRPVLVGHSDLIQPEHGNGYRLALNLTPCDQKRFDSQAGWPEGLPKTVYGGEPAPRHTASPGGARGIVVIDAGHGGIDSGTVGIDGLLEKNLVLDEALRLKRLLHSAGYTAYLTRESDIYVPLPDRVTIARGYQADLFISLHADSNPDSGVHGASIYTLSEQGSDREAAALAKKENQSDIVAGVDLSKQNVPVASILIDLAQRDTVNRSADFAELAIGQLQQTTDVLARTPHRSAAFAVLKSPDVPAVLVELGYLSNRQDCAQMETARWRDATAAALVAAVGKALHAGVATMAAK
jgi:N-acetylmuramoyl-L-alanine amidase